jgi:hypothetical protein
VELIMKEELLKEFEVEASFYKVAVNDQVFECRSQSRIKRKGVNKVEYDALLVLCNPGSCKGTISPPVLDPRVDKIAFVPAKSDPTQEQVMRLMVLQQWDHVNMINISDLCTGNIDNFKVMLKKAKKELITHHSIFSTERKSELLGLIELNKGPIIAGWGKKTFLKDQIKQVLLMNSFKDIKGWKHPNDPYYYHPNPQIQDKKKEWLIKVDDLLTKIG